jgi:hypothetical protein
MRLRRIYTGTVQYDSAPNVAMHGDGTGMLFGQGSGTVDWDGVAGMITWSNFPRYRPGDIFEPNITGSIHLETEKHPFLYELSGVSRAPDGDGNRLIVASVRWHTASEEFGWLNTSLGVEEAVLDGSTLIISTTTYVVEPAWRT